MQIRNVPVPQRGFTLIELSIVLVIIGLLAAGVLTGKDLIRAAEIRAEVSQIEKLDTAVNAFRLKYNCLPGDCIDAESQGLGVAGGDGRNGNGDGNIDGNQGNGAISDEAENFWVHLGNANLIDGHYTWGPVPGVNTPPLKMTGKGWQGNPRGGLWIITNIGILYPGMSSVRNSWLLTTTVTAAVSVGVYDPITAYGLDTKIDNGLPLSGKMLVAGGSGNSFLNDTNFANVSVFSTHGAQQNPAACVDDVDPANPRYNLTNPDANMPSQYSLCMPIIKAGF